jgi:hypothetical protein
MSKKRLPSPPPIIIIDTCIFLEILNVPGFNSRREEVIAAYKDFVKQGASFFLPMTAILETGNHIAKVNDGRLRRAAAERFVKQIKGALSGAAPWRPTPFPDRQEILGWIDSFADGVMKGPGFGDQTILHLWEKSCRDFPNRRVLIWTHDQDLAGHDRIP